MFSSMHFNISPEATTLEMLNCYRKQLIQRKRVLLRG